MTLSTYAHVIDELEGAEHRSAEGEIRHARDGQARVERLARAADVRDSFAPTVLAHVCGERNCLQIEKSRRGDLNSRPHHYE